MMWNINIKVPTGLYWNNRAMEKSPNQYSKLQLEQFLLLLYTCLYWAFQDTITLAEIAYQL